MEYASSVAAKILLFTHMPKSIPPLIPTNFTGKKAKTEKE